MGSGPYAADCKDCAPALPSPDVHPSALHSPPAPAPSGRGRPGPRSRLAACCGRWPTQSTPGPASSWGRWPPFQLAKPDGGACPLCLHLFSLLPMSACNQFMALMHALRVVHAQRTVHAYPIRCTTCSDSCCESKQEAEAWCILQGLFWKSKTRCGIVVRMHGYRPACWLLAGATKEIEQVQQTTGIKPLACCVYLIGSAASASKPSQGGEDRVAGAEQLPRHGEQSGACKQEIMCGQAARHAARKASRAQRRPVHTRGAGGPPTHARLPPPISRRRC